MVSVKEFGFKIVNFAVGEFSIAQMAKLGVNQAGVNALEAGLGSPEAMQEVSFGVAMSRLDESQHIKELAPDFSVLATTKNLPYAFLLLDVAMGTVHFDDQKKHPNSNKTVRAIATLDNVLHNKPDSGNKAVDFVHSKFQTAVKYTRAPIVFALPHLIPAAGASCADLAHGAEHLPIDLALIGMVAAGATYLLHDVAKIPAKMIESAQKAIAGRHKAPSLSSKVSKPALQVDTPPTQISNTRALFNRAHRQSVQLAKRIAPIESLAKQSPNTPDIIPDELKK